MPWNALTYGRKAEKLRLIGMAIATGCAAIAAGVGTEMWNSRKRSASSSTKSEEGEKKSSDTAESNMNTQTTETKDNTTKDTNTAKEKKTAEKILQK